jgi:hypothetical protein
MKDFYFFRTSKVLDILSRRELDKISNVFYLVYLVIMISGYFFLPSFLFPNSGKNIDGTKIETLLLQSCILLVSFLIIKVKFSQDIFGAIKNYIAIFATQIFLFFIVKMITGLVVIYFCIFLKLPIEPGFSDSHYLNLWSEMISVCGSDIIIQVLMIFRFKQMNRLRSV